MHGRDQYNSFEGRVLFLLGRLDANVQTLVQSRMTSASPIDADTRKIKKWRQAFGLLVDVYKATRLVPWGLVALGIVTAWKYALPHLQGWLVWLVR